MSNVKSFIKKYQLVKKLFNSVILSKLEVFGEYFINKKSVPLYVTNHSMQYDPEKLGHPVYCSAYKKLISRSNCEAFSIVFLSFPV